MWMVSFLIYLKTLNPNKSTIKIHMQAYPYSAVERVGFKEFL